MDMKLPDGVRDITGPQHPTKTHLYWERKRFYADCFLSGSGDDRGWHVVVWEFDDPDDHEEGGTSIMSQEFGDGPESRASALLFFAGAVATLNALEERS